MKLMRDEHKLSNLVFLASLFDIYGVGGGGGLSNPRTAVLTPERQCGPAARAAATLPHHGYGGSLKHLLPLF